MRNLPIFSTCCAALFIAACQGVSSSDTALPGAQPVYPTEAMQSVLNLSDEPDTQVMILGSWHFAGSTQDVVNVETDSVLTPKRQAELQQIADALCAFRPTAIVVEREGEAPNYIDPYFADYSSQMLTENPNERIQIGYRTAETCGVERVYAIDEQASEGEPDYFPFDKIMAHVETIGEMDAFGGLLGRMQAFGETFAETVAPMPLIDALIYANEGASSDPSLYYQLLQYDKGEAQPGAELLAYYTMRNAKIVSKIMDVTAPGDRVLVVYGAGHKHFLEQIIEYTPKMQRVDPIPYLEGG